MSSLVAFDKNGVLGPAVSLLFNINDLNPSGLEKLTEYAAQQFEKMSGRKPEGAQQLCQTAISCALGGKPLSVAEIVNLLFFKSMQWQGNLPVYHGIVLERIIPQTLTTLKGYFPDAPIEENKELLTEWLARFLETYVTEEQIRAMSKPKEDVAEATHAKRCEEGGKLYKLTQEGNFTEADLNALIASCKAAVGAPNPKEVNEMVRGYLELFAMGDEDLPEDVLEKLDTLFREKMFPSEK